MTKMKYYEETSALLHEFSEENQQYFDSNRPIVAKRLRHALLLLSLTKNTSDLDHLATDACRLLSIDFFLTFATKGK